jgi:hypothetical protein
MSSELLQITDIVGSVDSPRIDRDLPLSNIHFRLIKDVIMREYAEQGLASAQLMATN